MALLCLWWFFATWNYIPLIILAVIVLLYFFKIARRIFTFLIALLLLAWLLVQTDFVQNIIIGHVTGRLSTDLKTQVTIKHVSFSFFDKMDLDTVLIRDHTKDTLLYAGAVKMRVTDWFFWKSYADLKYIGLEDAVIKQQRKDSVWNYQFLADYFSSSDTAIKKDSSKKSIVFNFKKIDLKNVTYLKNDEWGGNKMTVKVGSMLLDADTIDIGRKLFLINSIELDKPYFTIENFDGRGPEQIDTTNLPDTGMYFNQGGIVAKIKSITLTNGFFGNLKRGEKSDKGVFDGDNIQASKLNGKIENFNFIKDTLRANIDLETKERSGFTLKKLKAAFRLTPRIMEFKDLTILTPKTHITDYFAMRFKDFNEDISEYVEKIVMDAHFRNTEVSSDDIAYFAPDLADWKRTATLSGRFYGTVANFNIKDLFLRTGSNTYLSGDLYMKGLPNVNSTTIRLTNANIQTNSNEISFLAPGLKTVTQPDLATLGNVHFRGAVSGTLVNYNVDGNLSTYLGGLYTKLTLSVPGKGEPVYKGHIQTHQFNIGKFINSDAIGNVSFTGDINGYSFALDKIKTSLNGNFDSLQFNGYTYTNLVFNGSIQKGKFNGDFNSDDPNFDLTSHIEVDLTGAQPAFNILGDLETANLKKLNFTTDNYQLTGLFDLNFQGRNIDEFLGSAKLLNAILKHDSTRLDFDSLTVTAFLDSANKKVLTATSNQFDVKIIGSQYSILDLPKSFQTFLSHYYPAYIEPPVIPAQNQHFAVIINTRDFDKYARLIDSNLSGLNNTHIEGRINTNDTGFNLLVQVPEAKYGKYKLEDAELSGKGDYDTLTLAGTIGRVYVGDSLYFPNSTLNIQSSNDHSTVHIATSANTTLNSAELNADVFTMPDGLHIDFAPSSFVLNDKKWNLEKEGELIIKRDFASASNVKFTQGFQEISVETDRSDSSNLQVKLKDVNLGDVVPLFVRQPRMEGIANGTVYLRDFFNKFSADANLQAEQFRLDDDSVGVVNVTANFNNQTGKVSFAAKSDNENYNFNITGYYNVSDSARSPLFTTGHFAGAKIGLLNEFLGDIFGNITGLATGDLSVSGNPSSPQLTGRMVLRDAGLTVKYTQVRYSIDSAVINFKNDGIDFGEFKVFDRDHNIGTVRGNLYEKGFKNMRFDFYMSTNKMLLLDTKPKDNPQFYGKAIGKASMSFTGPQEDMRMSIVGEVNDTTHIFIPTSNNRESADADFIRFKQYGKEITLPESQSKLNIDLDLTANNKAEIDVILDELTGDIIKATGNGRLRINIPASGSMTMKGRYNIEQGTYDFNFQSLIKKPFILPPDAGSYIEWTKDPYDANIHINAQYTAHNVSINDLIGNGTYQLGGAVQGYRGDVYVIAKLTQKLTRPNIDFSIDFPPESAIKNDQNFRLFLSKLESQPDEKLKQVTWLIVFGAFAPYGEGVGGGNNDNLVRSAGINTISQKISDEVNKMVAGVFSRVGLEFNVSTSTYSSSSLYGTSAAGNRLDRQNIDLKLNKSLLNGKLIVTVGSGFDFNISNATAVQSGNFQWLPDISVQILLARNAYRGTQLKAIVFNKSSLDVSSSGGGIGRRIRQGVSISYSFDFPIEKQRSNSPDSQRIAPVEKPRPIQPR
ncbi:MAG TPA: translocation/assembly module TamB domain-containing protein [Chitinophagaceae bacterium]|nr:translocation/assembly module TamB domain-containing protein [Chitinophagaceae bacterium]